MSYLHDYIKNYKYDRVLGPFFGIIFPGIILHGCIEYQDSGVSWYTARDILNTIVVLVAILLFLLSVIDKKQLVTWSVYSIAIAISYTFVLGNYDPSFDFEPLFLRSQMIFALVLFVSGTLIDHRHIISLTLINCGLIIFCAFTVGKDFSILKFLLCGLLVSGGGVAAFAGQKFVLALTKKVKAARILIEQQNRDLKEMNASKDQLFRIIGHDLRTPFHQLNLLTDLIIESKTDEEREEYGALIKESAMQGNELLEDLLSWSKVHIDKADIKLEKSSIRILINKTFEFFRFKSTNKNVKLVNSIPEDLQLVINNSMMETVFRNLIGNAIKFSQVNSQIIVKVVKTDKNVNLYIIDEGVGMTEEQLKAILSNTQGTITTLGTSNEKGTGNGIAIVKKLVERQNGSFSMYSEQQKGTTVRLTFPISNS